jgi:hypothetical protein
VTPGRVLAELEALAGRLGVEIREESFGKGVLRGRGGLCWVDGKALVVMDAGLALPERIGVIAGALGRMKEWEGASMPLAVRDRIEAARAGKKGKKRSRPGLARARRRG